VALEEGQVLGPRLAAVWPAQSFLLGPLQGLNRIIPTTLLSSPLLSREVTVK
jgi:hypothetical protein